MHIELFDIEKHYGVVSEWWKKQDWEVLPIHALPTVGMIAYDKEIPVASGFLYNTDSTFALIEFIVGNPDLDHKVRGEGLDIVINSLMDSAKLMDKKVILSYTSHKRLIDRYENHGFFKGDRDMIGMTKVL